MKTTQCPLCGKKIVYSRDDQYLHCEDLGCKYIIANLCVACRKGKYIHKIASHGIYKEIPFFQCNQCNNILDLQALAPTDRMKKALKES
jgi:ribosomal protein L37AE/L43A